MDKFRKASSEEKKILLNGIRKLSKEKCTVFLIMAGVWAVIWIIVLAAFAGVHHNNTATKIKRFSGSRPVFEDYEDYIMNHIISVSVETSLPKVETVDQFSSIIPYINPITTYSVMTEPEDYDYSELDFISINNSRRVYRSMSGLKLPKESQTYKDLAKRAKKLFDEEIDKRIAEAHPIEVRELIACIIGFAVYVIAILIAYKLLKNACNGRINEIVSDECLIAKATLFGRERYMRYRGSSLLYVEAQTEYNEKYRLRVRRLQYDSFKSNTACYVIKYKQCYSTYDEYDIVWATM